MIYIYFCKEQTFQKNGCKVTRNFRIKRRLSPFCTTFYKSAEKTRAAPFSHKAEARSACDIPSIKTTRARLPSVSRIKPPFTCQRTSFSPLLFMENHCGRFGSRRTAVAGGMNSPKKKSVICSWMK